MKRWWRNCPQGSPLPRYALHCLIPSVLPVPDNLCSQLASRKQFIEYKLKLATRVGSDGSSSSAGGVSAADRAALIAELTEVQANAEALVRQYERRFGEPYLRMTPAGPETAAPATPSHNGKHFYI